MTEVSSSPSPTRCDSGASRLRAARAAPLC